MMMPVMRDAGDNVHEDAKHCIETRSWLVHGLPPVGGAHGRSPPPRTLAEIYFLPTKATLLSKKA